MRALGLLLLALGLVARVDPFVWPFESSLMDYPGERRAADMAPEGLAIAVQLFVYTQAAESCFARAGA